MATRKRVPFTLIELLAVIFIISILIALTVGLSSMALNKAAASKTVTRMQAMETALEEYHQDRGYYPPATTTIRIDGTAAPFNTAGNFQNTQTGRTYLDGYAGGNPYNDGYGEAFYYRCGSTSDHNPEKFDLWSAGNDGTSGTTDDICNWKSN